MSDKMRDKISDKNIDKSFADQIAACHMFGSSLTAEILTAMRADFANGKIIDTLVGDWAGDPANDNIALRLAGFIHFVALGGDARLRAFFASCGGAFDPANTEELHKAVIEALETRSDAARAFLRTPPQTNETGRAGVLLLGFSEIARRTALPLRVRELGASAGLNLNFDRFHYALKNANGTIEWGDPQSPLTVESDWKGNAPALVSQIDVADRRGCDIAPIDTGDATARRKLESYIWGDMQARRARLLAALEIAAAHPVQVDKADAAQWVLAQLEARPKGQVTIIYHSIFWPYLDPSQRNAIETAITQAGAGATPDAPVAWLQLDFEHIQGIPNLAYRLWAGDSKTDGQETVLGACHPHGADMQLVDRV